MENWGWLWKVKGWNQKATITISPKTLWLVSWLVFFSFLSTWQQLQSSESRQPQWRQRFPWYQTSLYGYFLSDWCGGPSPLWMWPLLSWFPNFYKKAGQASHRSNPVNGTLLQPLGQLPPGSIPVQFLPQLPTVDGGSGCVSQIKHFFPK